MIAAHQKKRLDLILVDRKIASTRNQARSLIMAGKVYVNSIIVDKPGTLIINAPSESEISIKENIPYVSRGGIKLQKALLDFNIRPEGYICLDVGASTGGFTDCLLQHGAKTVFAVDVGYGQLAWELRQDARVTVIERTNIRYMPKDALPCQVDLVTIDVSFISLKIVVPAILKFMKTEARIIALIKPQFEIGKGGVGKNGVVRAPEKHKAVIQDISDYFNSMGLTSSAAIPSPILGPKGNKEFFVLLGY